VLLGECAETRGVGVGHIEESFSEAIVVRAGEGVESGEVDVIADEDERALRVAGVDSSGGVGDDDTMDAHAAEDAHREGDFGGRVSFVAVHAALHDSDWRGRELADEQFAAVSFDRGAREVWDFGVGNRCGFGDVGCYFAEAGAEDDGDFWRQRCLCADEVRSGVRPEEEVVWHLLPVGDDRHDDDADDDYECDGEEERLRFVPVAMLDGVLAHVPPMGGQKVLKSSNERL